LQPVRGAPQPAAAAAVMSPGAHPAILLEWARKLQAIAQNGLTFSRDPFDRERYSQLQALAADMLSAELAIPAVRAHALWEGERGYATPKVDVRGGVFDGDQVLLVRERSDGRWTLPGGWVDVNDAPSEAVAREIHEESGYRARAVKLAALVDRNRHPHPPGVYHIYKLFFVCELTGGSPLAGHETDAVAFFRCAPCRSCPRAVSWVRRSSGCMSTAETRPGDRLRLRARIVSCPAPLTHLPHWRRTAPARSSMLSPITMRSSVPLRVARRCASTPATGATASRTPSSASGSTTAW